MGSGASKEEEVGHDSQFVKSETAAFSDGQKSRPQDNKASKSQPEQGSSETKRRSARISRVEGYESKIIQITKDGFTSSDVTIMEGQVVIFVWDESCSPAMSVFQVVHDGETLTPVVGGFGAAPTDHQREYEQLFNVEGEYKFAIKTIRCTPLTVRVTTREDLHGDVTDKGFLPPIIYLDQGHTICWSWQSCDVPHTVTEVGYAIDKGCFRLHQNKGSHMIATVSGKHRHQFKYPGIYYFMTESSELGRHHLCVVCVRAGTREHKIEVLDRSFRPMILVAEEGDRVWWSWDKSKCQKLHHVYQINEPGDDYKEDSPYEPTPEGFKWHKPSNQGLMSHQFRQAGVYYFSDQSYNETAAYIGTVIVRPKPKEHRIQISGKAFKPDVLYVQTGDRVMWTWDGETAVNAAENFLIVQEDSVLPNEAEPAEDDGDEKLLRRLDQEAIQLMTKIGTTITSFGLIGLYTYKISDKSDSANSCSIIVNPGTKNHTVHLTDTGIEPKVLTISPNDRVWWVWQTGNRQHNIQQVSHARSPIKDGFSSGQARDCPSAFQHQFQSPGVYYFESKGLQKVYGAIFVHTQPQVHEVTVGKEIVPDPVTVQLGDVICWVFKNLVRHGIMEVASVDQVVDAAVTNMPISNRRCIGQAVKNLGLTHYYSKSFHKKGKHKDVTEETKLCTAVCDKRGDFTIIRVTTKRGFHPKEVHLEKGKSVMWTWRGLSEHHNIVHVHINSPQNPVTGTNAFSSGKPVDDNCFIYTFDEPGNYKVISHGAPGFSCVIRIRDMLTRTSEPYNSSEKKGGTVDHGYRVDLGCKTEGAEIYYTTDGSLPGPHHYTTKHYYSNKGILLKKSGLCCVRAIAIKSGQVFSYVFTSRRYWVLSGGNDDNPEEEDANSEAGDEKQGVPYWDWWNCRPHIKGCFTGPGTINLFWDLPNSEASRKEIKGYQVFLNGVSYCSMFPITNNSLHIQGLAGGHKYKIVVRVYPKDAQYTEIESNSLNLECPAETDVGGPLISLVKSEKPDSLSIVWLSMDKPELPVDGYRIYLNDQQFGPKLVPDPEHRNCKVVISDCKLNASYRIYVQALLANSGETLKSNILEVYLPVDTSHFKYPPVEEMEKNDKDLYMECLKVSEGSGYLPAMDDPNNEIWETDTDSGSGSIDEERPRKRRKKMKTASVLATGAVVQPVSSTEGAQAMPSDASDPVVAALVSKDSSLENSSKANQRDLDKGTVYYDAEKDEATSPDESDALMKERLKKEQLDPESGVGGPVVIEIQKSEAVDKMGKKIKAGGEKMARISTEKASMVRVGEGEYVCGDRDGLLPSPTIMAESQGLGGMKVGWKVEEDVEGLDYRPQLFVVNVVGERFSSEISSDTSFECNILEKDKQVQGVHHCWNVQYQPKKLQYESEINGLLPELTYRVYVVANYVLVKGNKPCEAQTTSTVLYYTIQGPPRCPTLWISEVGLYSACVQWEGPALDGGQKLKGYHIFVNGKPLEKRYSIDIQKMVLENMIPGKTINLFVKAVSEFAEQESQPTRTVYITCPARPPAPVISQQSSFKQGSVLMSWNKPQGWTVSSNREAISYYSVYIDDKWHGEVKANKLSDQQGYQFYLTDLSSEQGYDISVRAVSGELTVNPDTQHVFCLSESPMSNTVPVMAPAAPRSPTLRLEGLHPDGIDVTWQVPQQCGDAVISGYQMLRNGKLYGAVIPPDVTSLHIRDVTLGEKLELQLIALTEHAVGKQGSKKEVDKDSGKGSSQNDEKASNSPSRKNTSARLIEFKGVEGLIDYSDWPTVLKDVFAGEHYTGCKPGPKLVVHYTGLVRAPTEVRCEKVTGHSAFITWKKKSNSKAHFLQPESYQVTWWPGERAQDEVQSDSTTEEQLLLTNLRPSTTYTVVVESRKVEKYKDYNENGSKTEDHDGVNAFILFNKSKPLTLRTASPPDPPSNVGVVAITCHSVKLGWDPPKANGSKIIGLRIECISLDPAKYHHVTVDALPDSIVAEVPGLHERTEYCVKLIVMTEEFFNLLPEKHPYKQTRSFPKDVLSSQQDSRWLPCSSILTKTSGTECATNIRVTKATKTSLTLGWTPPLVEGSNKLTGQTVRWSVVRKNHRADQEELQTTSHTNLLPTEDSLTIDSLISGAQYKIVIEAVVSVKTALEPDKWDASNIEKYRRTTNVMSKPFYARTRAPIDPPKVIVSSYTQNTASLYWEKPLLMSVTGKDGDGNPRYLCRYLQGYKLEVNGKLQCCMGPDTNSCTLIKCKPGHTYSVVLVAMTCTEEGMKARKQKFKDYRISPNSQEVDYMTFLQDDEDLDESPSELVEVTIPKDQEGYLKSLEAKFQHTKQKNNKTLGDIDLSWTVQGKTDLLKQFSIVWYNMEERVIQTKYVGPQERRATVPVTRNKTIYSIKVEPAYLTDVLPQHAQEVQVIVPGSPDPPEIFLKSQDTDEFCIEWGEPKLYGGVKVKGYQVYLNDKKAGNELNANHTKATIPCRPKRTCRVHVVALSDEPEYGNSSKSNTLVINPSDQPGAATESDTPHLEDSSFPVRVAMVTDSSFQLDWSRFVETDEVAYYKIQWNSVAQPELREVKLSEKDSNCVINKCLPGTTYFVRLIAYNASGQVVENFKQMTVQTSAPPDAPRLSVRACNFRYISIQWEKPTTYGDALITGYKVYVNGVVEATLNTDQHSYTYSQGKTCQEYAFQVQAMSTSDHLNGKPSEPLVVTWPGSKAPAVWQLPSVSSSNLRVRWDEPYLTEGLKIKHFTLVCKEGDSEKVVQKLGPLHATAREGEFKNLKQGNYSIYLETFLFGSDKVIRSEIMHMQPQVSPDPPQITVTLAGLEERRHIEKFTCDLVNKRDRLIHQVGNKLKKIGALTFPLRAEKNEDVLNGAQKLTRIEELLEHCFTLLEDYTGHLNVHLSWQCPQSNSEIHLSGYKVLLDGKQYGNSLPASVKSIRLKLGLNQPSYRLSVVAISEKPQGVSGESNTVEILSMPFKPFTFYCYHTIHRKDVKYPAFGCCKFQDSIEHERKVAKKLANQGLLQKQVPPPSCRLMSLFDGEFKPLMSTHNKSCSTVIFFWASWCLSSQKMMDHFIRFAKENAKQMTYLAVACGAAGTNATSRKSLAHIITANSWREDHVVWHATSDCILEEKNEQDNAKENCRNLIDVLGIAGVPTLLFIHPEGHIAWHGRYCAFDYPAFESFMRHTLAEVVGRSCPISVCDCCSNDTTVNEDAISQYMKDLSPSHHTLSRAAMPYGFWSPRNTKYGSSDSISGSEWAHATKVRKLRPYSPKRRIKYNISVNKRPCSASDVAGMLENSPYSLCVAPHLHKPHKITPRPASAKFVNH